MPIHVKNKVIVETLAMHPRDGKHLLEPLKSFAASSGFPVNILEDRKITNEAEIHENEGDLWYCLKGEVTFVCGGVLESQKAHPTKSGEWSGSGIKGGEDYVLHPGDWLWIPPGEPHLHKTDGIARLAIIKIPKK